MSNKTASILRTEIDGSVLDLSNKLAKQVTIDGETGSVTFDEDYTQTLLGDEFTLEQKTALDKRIILGADATHLAVGEAAVDAFKANSELQQVNGMLQYGGQTLEVNIARTGNVRNFKTGEVNTVYAPGVTKVAYRKATNKAQFKRVRTALQALAAEELGE